MKALSLWQPWASEIARGRKTIETRMWSTRYRGPLLVCASKHVDRTCCDPGLAYPRGMAVAICRLVDCREMRGGDEVAAMCQWEPGRYSWVLADVRSIKPFPVRGRQRLFDVDLPVSALSAIYPVRSGT